MKLFFAYADDASLDFLTMPVYSYEHQHYDFSNTGDLIFSFKGSCHRDIYPIDCRLDDLDKAYMWETIKNFAPKVKLSFSMNALTTFMNNAQEPNLGKQFKQQMLKASNKLDLRYIINLDQFFFY
jgi:hypothetical protein